MNFSDKPVSELKEIEAPKAEAAISDADIMQLGNHTNTLDFNDSAASNDNNDNAAGSDNAASNGAYSTKAGDLIGGKLVVNIVDSLLPSLAVFIVGYFKYKIDKKTLQLSAKEKEVIEPAFQQYLDSINIRMDNPLNNLLLVLFTIYGAKAFEAIPSATKVKPEKKAVTGDVEATAEFANYGEWYEAEISKLQKKRKKPRAATEEYFAKNFAPQIEAAKLKYK